MFITLCVSTILHLQHVEIYFSYFHTVVISNNDILIMELIAGKTSESLKRHPIQEGKSMSKKIKPQWGTGVRQKHHKIKKAASH